MIISAVAAGVLILGLVFLASLTQGSPVRRRSAAGSEGSASAFSDGGDGCDSGSGGDGGCGDGGGGGGD